MRVQSIKYWNSVFIYTQNFYDAREKNLDSNFLTVKLWLNPFKTRTIAFSTFTFGFVYLFGRVPYSIADFKVRLLSADGLRSYEYRLYSNEKYGNYGL